MEFQIPETVERKLSAKLKVAMVVGAVVVIAGATAAGYYMAQKKSTKRPVIQDDAVVPPTNTVGETIPDLIIENNQTVINFPTTSLSQEIEKKVVWSQPKKLNDLHWFVDKKSYAPAPENSGYAVVMFNEYYEVGTFEYNGERGRIVLVQIQPDEPSSPWYFYILEFKNRLTVLAKYSWWEGYDRSYALEGGADLQNYLANFTGETQKLVTVDFNFRINDFEFPKTLQGPEEGQFLNLKGFYPLRERIQMNSIVFPEDRLVFTDPQFGKVYTSSVTGGFYLHGPGDSRAIYALEPNFFNKNNALAQIVWNDGSWNGYEFTYQDQGGCGFVNYVSIMTSTDVTATGVLEVVGKTSKGDDVYEIRDKNHRFLKDFYNKAYFPGGYDETSGYYNKISYEEFITLRPLIFWKDPFGRLVKLINRRFVSPAECGKPVIYLYPEKTTNVLVKVEPKGGMTVSDPFYNGGWNVQAEPNGQLTEVKSGKQYPYLFWEGTGGLYQTPEKGFVMKKENIATELPEKLMQLGLNEQETKDFMEFWLPKMQAKPYYFVTFLGTQQMNQLAPLTINPRPDTVVRILMDFTPLDKSLEVLPLPLGGTPARNGFTVIEWGGVLR